MKATRLETKRTQRVATQYVQEMSSGHRAKDGDHQTKA